MSTEEISSDEEFIALADAAKKLNISIPRLRRFLAKPEWKNSVRQVERSTKTGMRSTAVVSVSVLSDLAKALEEKEHEPHSGQLIPAMQKTLSEKDSEIEYLRNALRFAQESLLREQIAHAETRRLLAAPSPIEPPKDESEANTVSETETKISTSESVSVSDAPEIAEEQKTEIESESPKQAKPSKKGWLRRLFGA